MKYELFPLIFFGIQNDFGKLLNVLTTLGANSSSKAL